MSAIHRNLSHLTKSFLGHTSIEDVDTKDIKALIDQYPYCHALYFLQMHKEAEIHQISNLALFTPNPLIAFQMATVEVAYNADLYDNTVVETTTSKAGTPAEKASPAPALSEEIASVVAVSDASAESEAASPAVQKKTAVARTSSVPKKSPKKTTPQKTSPETGSKEQLQSFMEWLNYMNGLSPSVHMEALSKITGTEKVEMDSERSIQENEIVSESMAEVWLSQNEPEKAIDIYEKLCLLFPDKTTYFANLIASIKTKK